MLYHRGLIGLTTCLFLSMLTFGCAGNPAGNANSAGDEGQLAQLRGLEDIPFPGPDADPIRAANAESEDELPGRTTYRRSSGAITNGNVLELGAAPGHVEYAIYRFEGLCDMDLPLELVVKRSNLVVGGYCLGVADYNTQGWVWSQQEGAGAPTVTDTFPVPPTVNGVSPGGSLYAALVVWNDRAMTVESIALTTDIDLEAPVADFTVTPGHGDAPLLVEFDASTSFVRGGGAISSYGWDFDNDGTIDETNVVNFTSHTYDAPGEYHPRLVVTADNGYTDDHTRPVYCHHWISTWGAGEGDGARGVVLNNKELYTAGWTTNEGDLDCLVTKYDVWGNPQWQRALGDPGGSIAEYASGITSLGDYGVAIAGKADTADGENLFVARYDFAGNLLWQRAWDSGGTEAPPSIAADGYGNTYVSAQYILDGETDHLTALLKYSVEGDLLWEKSLNEWWDQGNSALCHFFGSLYFTSSLYPAGGTNLAICVLDLDGEVTSSARYVLDQVTVPYAISADISGNVYVTGRYFATTNRVFMLKADSSLEPQWFRAWEFEQGESVGFGLGLNQFVPDPDELQMAITLTPDTGFEKGALFTVDSSGVQTGAWVFTSSDSDMSFFAMCQNQYYGVVLAGCSSSVDASSVTSIIMPPHIDISNSKNALAATTSDMTGSELSATGVSYVPPGVHDLGGGGKDHLLIGVDTSTL